MMLDITKSGVSMTEVFNEIRTQLNNPQMQAAMQQNTVQPLAQAPITVREALAAPQMQSADTVQIAGAQKVKKEGPIKSLKRGVANIKKFFATVGEFVKGIGKGIISGAVAGAVVYAVTDVAHKLGKNAAKKSRSPIYAIATAVIALGANLWKASLNATDRRSDIHDRYIGTEKK